MSSSSSLGCSRLARAQLRVPQAERRNDCEHPTTKDTRSDPKFAWTSLVAALTLANEMASRRGALLQSKYRYLGGGDLGWPQNLGEARCNSDILDSVDRISDDAATNRAADFPAPHSAPVRRVEDVEISAHVAEEDDASGARRHAALNRIVRLCPPSPGAGVGIDGIDPTRPVENRVRLTPGVERIDGCLRGPRRARRGRSDLVGRHQGDRGAPLDLADDDEVRGRIIGRTIPLGAAGRTGTEVDGFADRKRRIGILDTGDRLPVEQGTGVEIEAVQVAVFRGDRQNLPPARGPDDGRSTGNVPIVPVFWHDLEVAPVSPGPRVEDDDRAGIKVRPLTHAGGKIRRGVPARHI